MSDKRYRTVMAIIIILFALVAIFGSLKLCKIPETYYGQRQDIKMRK